MWVYDRVSECVCACVRACMRVLVRMCVFITVSFRILFRVTNLRFECRLHDRSKCVCRYQRIFTELSEIPEHILSTMTVRITLY